MNDSEYHMMAEIQKNHWWYVARRKIISKTISTLGFTKPIDILEVGCGVGANLEALVPFGTLYATDYHQTAVDYTKALNLAKEVQIGHLPDSPAFKDQKFDLIVMLDVLEHIDDDLKTLTVLKNQLHKGGQLLITVPAFRFLWSSHDVFVHHKRRYHLPDLQKICHEAGYRVHYISYFNCFLFPLIYLGRQVLKIVSSGRTESPQSDLIPTNSIVNWILKTIFGFERFFVPNIKFPFGVSLMAICEPLENK